MYNDGINSKTYRERNGKVCLVIKYNKCLSTRIFQTWWNPSLKASICTCTHPWVFYKGDTWEDTWRDMQLQKGRELKIPVPWYRASFAALPPAARTHACLSLSPVWEKQLTQVPSCPIITTRNASDWTIEIQHNMFRIAESQDSADKNTCGEKN